MSFSRSQTVVKEAMTGFNAEALEKMFDAITPMSTGSGISVNVDGSGSELEDGALLSPSQQDADFVDHDDAETASVRSDSTDGGRSGIPSFNNVLFSV